MRNVGRCANERVIQRLSVQPPSAFLVNYMKGVTKEFKVEIEPDEAQVADLLAPTGTTVMSHES